MANLLTNEALATVLKAALLDGPELLETKQTFEAGGGQTVSAALATAGVAPQAVADAANVAAVVTALKAMGIFVDP